MDTNKIELRHLRSLCALRETGSILEASERVYLTQSALSHQIRKLEDRLGGPILLRRSRPVQFTAVGNRLLELADQVLPLVRNATIDIAQLTSGNTGRLHLAVECHSCFDWLLPALTAYREEWNGVDLDVASGFHYEPLPALSRGELDLVITADPLYDLGLYYEPLFQYESQLGIGTMHSLNKVNRKYINPEELNDSTIVTYPIEHNRLEIFKNFLDPAGVEPKQTRHCELTSMIIHVVASGRGVTCLPNWVLEEYTEKDYLNTKSLGKQGQWSTLWAAVRHDRAHLTYIQAFFEVARSTCFNTLPGIRPVPEAQKPVEIHNGNQGTSVSPVHLPA